MENFLYMFNTVTVNKEVSLYVFQKYFLQRSCNHDTWCLNKIFASKEYVDDSLGWVHALPAANIRMNNIGEN